MGKIKGDLNPPKYRESRELWFATLDLGRGPDGKRRKVEVSSKTRAGCIEKRMARMKEIEDGTYTPGVKPKVGEWVEHWCDEIQSEKVAPRTLANYRSYVRKHIIPHVGARRLDALSADDVRHLHREMRDAGVSDRTVQAVHNTLSVALKAAVREGKIPQNVCDMMDRPRARMQERGSYSRAEVKAILTTAEGDGPGEYSRWMAALTLGSRQAELLAFEWSRLDLDAGMADLSWQVQQLPWRHGHGCACGPEESPRRCRHKEPDAPSWYELRPAYKGLWFTRPKTAAGVRALPLPGPLVDALREWRETAPTTSLGLVWPDNRGLPRLGREDREAWTDLCRRAGVRQLTLHSARHTMVSLLLDDGVDPEVIRQIAGHSTILSTRGYMHVSADRARDALARLAG